MVATVCPVATEKGRKPSKAWPASPSQCGRSLTLGWQRCAVLSGLMYVHPVNEKAWRRGSKATEWRPGHGSRVPPPEPVPGVRGAQDGVRVVGAPHLRPCCSQVLPPHCTSDIHRSKLYFKRPQTSPGTWCSSQTKSVPCTRGKRTAGLMEGFRVPPLRCFGAWAWPSVLPSSTPPETPHRNWARPQSTPAAGWGGGLG